MKTLPDADAARSEFARRYVRSLVALLIRVVAVGLLVALLMAQFPGLKVVRPVLDALSGVLVLVPFFVAVGRLFAERIRLGQAYIEAKRDADAETILAPVRGWQARIFDNTGEGVFYRAVAAANLGRHAEARTLFAEVPPGTIWHEKAVERLRNLEGKSDVVS